MAKGKVKNGKVSKLDDLTPAHYRGFLDDDLLERVERVYKQRANHRENSRPPKADFIPPLFYRVIFCPYCNLRLEAHRAKGTYYYYRHKSGTGCQNGGEIAARFLDAICWELPPIQRLLNLTDDEKERIVQIALGQNTDKGIEQERQGILAQLERLEDVALDELLNTGVVSTDKFKVRRAQLTERLNALPTAPRIPITRESVVRQLNEIGTLLTKIKETAPHIANKTMRDLFETIRFDIKARRVVGYAVQSDAARWLGLPVREIGM